MVRSQQGSPLNIDNVDAWNEDWRVVMSLCGNGASDEGDYFYLTGGSGPRYPERARDLRYEWDIKSSKKFDSLSGHGHSDHAFKVGGEIIDYTTVVVYPHLTKPEIVLDEHRDKNGNKLYHLIVKLPKYFDGHLIATYTDIACVDNKTLTVRMLRGSVERNFLITISRDPKDIDQSLKWWTR